MMLDLTLSVHTEDISTTEIRYILENPWKISEFEWLLDSETAIDRALEHVVRRLAQATEDGYCKLWKLEEAEPVALLACYRVGESRYETLFVASKLMESYAMKISLEMRHILQQQSRIFRGCTCGLYSISEHPRQIAWFRFLGFTYVPKGNAGNARYFEYTAPP